jgi:hypothetical protein
MTGRDAPAEDIRIGQLAVHQGLINGEDLTRLLKVQKSLHDSGVRRRLGQMMIMHDLITPQQLDDLLRLQAERRGKGS